jgi:hypothetical protein
LPDTLTPFNVATVRELPPSEWPKLLEMPGPYHDAGIIPDPRHNRILVLEKEGVIKAYWGVFTVVHVEPVYISEDCRHKISVVRPLWEAMRAMLVRLEVPGAVAIISDVDAPINLPMAVKLGFEKVPGSLYYLDLKVPLYFPQERKDP